MSAAFDEEQARAEVYGLLARLFHAAPDAELHAQLRAASGAEAPAGSLLGPGWSELVASARRLSTERIADEYAALFQGIGKPEVFLHGSWHLAGNLNEKPLVELRRDLARLGLERAEDAVETEDHVASLFAVMRHLIGDADADADASRSALTAQRRFFDAHIRAWIERLCDVVDSHPRADFYRAVARFTRDFAAVEGQAFDLLDA